MNAMIVDIGDHGARMQISSHDGKVMIGCDAADPEQACAVAAALKEAAKEARRQRRESRRKR